MNIAEERHHAWVSKLEGLPLTLWPGPQVVSQLLVPTNSGPEDVVSYAVAIEELNRCALLNHYKVRHEHQAFLVDGDAVKAGAGQVSAGKLPNVDDGFTLDS